MFIANKNKTLILGWKLQKILVKSAFNTKKLDVNATKNNDKVPKHKAWKGSTNGSINDNIWFDDILYACRHIVITQCNVIL